MYRSIKSRPLMRNNSTYNIGNLLPEFFKFRCLIYEKGSKIRRDKYHLDNLVLLTIKGDRRLRTSGSTERKSRTKLMFKV